jgi:uracil-DNA glycosylase family 4
MIKPPDCAGCVLGSGKWESDGYVMSEGEGSNGVVVLGEAGGYNEFIDGLPFRPHAQSGSKLEEAFKIVGREIGQPVSRNQFLLYNVINCHPKGDLLVGMPYEKEAIASCSRNVDRVVGGFHTNKNKTILALGNVPLKYLTGVSGIAEEKQSISHLRGYVFQSKYGLVVPSLHPSFIRRGNNHLTPLLVEDIKKALGVASGAFSSYQYHKDYKPPEYQVKPSLDEAWSFYYKVKDSPRAILSYDIETPMSGETDEDERDELEGKDINLVQFSIAKGTGIAFPFNSDYLSIIGTLFNLENVKANHNTWNFDNPRLRAANIQIRGKTHDTMWMFKHWHSRLPRGLQNAASLVGFPFPWKHLYGTNLEWYGCADVDAVQWLVAALPGMMDRLGIWGHKGDGRGYRNHVYEIHPIMDRASLTGIPVNEEKRLKVGGILEDGTVDPNAGEESFTKRRKKLDKEIQGIIPDECRNIKPKRKDKETGEIDYGYIREPKIVASEYETYQRLSKRLLADGKRVASFEDFLYRKHNLANCEFEVLDGGVRTVIERWAIVEPFKASKDQLVRYLRWKQREVLKEAEGVREKREIEFGGRNPELTAEIRRLEELAEDYEIPLTKDKKTKEWKETTAKNELEEMFLNTGDPILEKVVEIRSYDTNINNYLPNWKPSKDGRVHTTWGYTAPTGQFDARRPNILNCSKHTEFGNEFRGIIEAPRGYTFIEFDFKSYHVATMGYCANDRDYIRYSQLDPHSILGSYIDPNILGGSIDLKWSDRDIKIAAEEFKKRSKEAGKRDHGIDVRQKLAKPTVLGEQLELGEKRLQRQNRRFIHYATKRDRLYHKGEGLSAEELQGIVRGIFPKPLAYRNYIKEKAFLEKYLVNEFGYVQYFYDVFNFSFNKRKVKWEKREGEGAREPIAFRVQGTAFGKIHLDMLECERLGFNEEFNFVNSIHDSLFFMVELGKVDRCIEEVGNILRKPCRLLVNEATGVEGLKVGVEVSMGRNWKAYDVNTNPEGMKEIKDAFGA